MRRCQKAIFWIWDMYFRLLLFFYKHASDYFGLLTLLVDYCCHTTEGGRQVSSRNTEFIEQRHGME